MRIIIMSTLAKVLLILASLAVVFVVFPVIYAFSTYRTVVTMEETVNAGWAQVGNQYQRRFDLIPNLVETVKGVADFEKSTFTAVAEARASVNNIKMTPELLNSPEMFSKFEQSQQNLGSALGRLLVTVEKYPELKANENFTKLQIQLEGTENRIAVARKNFNEDVENFNKYIRVPPQSWIASLFGFSPKEYFKPTEGSEVAPTVKF